MRTLEQVRCPNCGKIASREYFPSHRIKQTACPACDYFLMSCALTGKVLECYAPGLYAVRT
jgi:NAD-dependent SIR2 family protein deacetylase